MFVTVKKTQVLHFMLKLGWNIIGLWAFWSFHKQSSNKRTKPFSGSAWFHGFTQYKTKPKLVWKSKFTRLASTHRVSVSCKQFLDVWIGHSQFISPFFVGVFSPILFCCPGRKTSAHWIDLDWPLRCQTTGGWRCVFPEFPAQGVARRRSRSRSPWRFVWQWSLWIMESLMFSLRILWSVETWDVQRLPWPGGSSTWQKAWDTQGIPGARDGICLVVSIVAMFF